MLFDVLAHRVDSVKELLACNIMYDQQSLIFTDKESKKDSKPVLQSSLPQQSKKMCKPQISLHTSSSSPCKLCQDGSHRLISCPTYKNMDPVARLEAVQSVRSCFNCLGSDHSVKTCPRKKGCRECGKHHHTLLHCSNDHQLNRN